MPGSCCWGVLPVPQGPPTHLLQGEVLCTDQQRDVLPVSLVHPKGACWRSRQGRGRHSGWLVAFVLRPLPLLLTNDTPHRVREATAEEY